MDTTEMDTSSAITGPHKLLAEGELWGYHGGVVIHYGHCIVVDNIGCLG